MTDAFEQDNCTDVYYVDFSCAFDGVSLPKLVQKLVAYDICGNCIELLRAFLMNRTMYAKVSHVFSDNIIQLSSVREGNVVSPLCFFAFINDISKYIKYCKMKLYVDNLNNF